VLFLKKRNAGRFVDDMGKLLNGVLPNIIVRSSEFGVKQLISTETRILHLGERGKGNCESDGK
jgi:hypothetical protein